MSYVYSPSKNAFYPKSLQSTYVSAGTWPDDEIAVSDEVFTQYTDTPPIGKIRMAGDNGLPEWGDTPQTQESDEQRKARARSLRDSFILSTDKLLIDDYTINNEVITDEQRTELMEVRASYKSWPQAEGWPNIELPDIPQWLLIEAVNNGYVVYSWPE